MLVRTAVIAALAAFSASVVAQSTYTQVGQYNLPFLGGQASTTIDGSGRLWRLVGSNVYRQDAINSSSFSLIGSVDASGGGFSVSPDGQRFAFIADNQTVRSGLTNTLSTTSPTTTNSTTPGGTLGSGGIVWSGQSFYVSGFLQEIPGPGGGIPASAVIYRITGDTSPAVATVASVPGISPVGSARGLATMAGRVYWEYNRGFDDSQVAVVDLATLDAAMMPVVNPAVVFNTVTPGRALLVDGNSTVISLSQSFSNFGQLFNGFTGATNPAPGGIGGPATFAVYNQITAELIIGTVRGGEVALRYTIPTPGASALIGLAGLVATRRRR